MFDFLKLGKAISGLKEQIAGIDQAIDAKQKEVDRLQNAPISKEDAITYFHRRIDTIGGEFDASLQFTIDRLNRNPGLGLDRHDAVGILTAGREANPRGFEAALLSLLGSEIKKVVADRIKAMPWPEAGPSLQRRPELLTTATAELQALITDRETMRRQAAESGILV